MHIIKLLQKEYSDSIEISEIGRTHFDNPIYAISFKSNNLNVDSRILFTGLHHAREPISLSMNFFVFFKILFELHLKNEDYEELVYSRKIHFVPLINVDGYEFNVDIYESVNGNEYGYARKNRRIGSEFSECEK